MRSKNHFHQREHAASRPCRPIGRKAVHLVSLLACIGGAGLLVGCPGGIEALFGRGQPPADVLGVSPNRGPVLGGTRVTITGLDAPAFGPGTDVLFGGFLGADTEVVDETTIRTTAPAQAAGHVDVAVRVADGTDVTRPDGFEYVAIADADAEILAQIEQMFPGPPRLVSAVSTSNISARVTFSEPVRDGATDSSNYSIVIPEGGVLLLNRSKAPELRQDHTVVDLTTLSQADALYRLTVTGIRDLAGNPIAPPDMLVNPAETTFTGIAPANLDEHIDTDGDGFADCFEMLGWELTIELANGVRVQGYVTSDPYNPDTDGDGMTDGEENARSMDPRTDDTDADLVLDAEEVFDWRSDPCDQDSDDDGFADQTEVHFETSLILADTDGDQLDDRDELLNRNRNPRIADLPVVVITVGEMNLELDERYTYTDQFGEEHQVQESFSNTVQRDTSSSLSATISASVAAHIETKVGAKTGLEVGKTTEGWGGKWHGEVNGYYVDLFDDDPTDGVRTRVFVYSDPLSTDTDGDGLLDGMELQFGTNPARDDSNAVFDDDVDGLPNRVEETGWLVDIGGIERRVFSDPDDPDSDNDYLPDYVEWVLGTSPRYYEGQTVDPDSAAPGFDTDQDGLSDYEEWDGTVPPQD